MFQQNIGINQLIDTSHVLCWAATWQHEEEIMFDSVMQSTRRAMIKSIWKLLDEADVVVHYNGSRFDIPTLNKEFLLHGLTPPSPYKQVDLLRTCRNRFRFTSNKLDFVAQQLGLKGKTKHEGHELWLKCMNRDPEAWVKMEEYNINDVIILEQVYDAVLPWITNHPNISIFKGELVCPSCGGTHVQRRGMARLIAGVYQKFVCLDCGAWSRDTKNLAEKTETRRGVH